VGAADACIRVIPSILIINRTMRDRDHPGVSVGAADSDASCIDRIDCGAAWDVFNAMQSIP
jgi:hypothetical protein